MHKLKQTKSPSTPSPWPALACRNKHLAFKEFTGSQESSLKPILGSKESCLLTLKNQ